MTDIYNLLNSMACEESIFLRSEFLAPVVSGTTIIQTRVAGVVAKFKAITQKDFQGWAIFKPLNWKRAQMTQEADFSEIEKYLKIFPKIQMILSQPQKNHWLAHPVNSGDVAQRFGWTKGEMKPIFLVTGAEKFEQVICRFDGANLWFEELNTSRDPLVADELKQAFSKDISVEDIRLPGLTPEEKLCYAFSFGMETKEREKRYVDETRAQLKKALGFSKASLVSYIDQGQNLLVRYTVDGTEYSSSVAKGNLSVVSAGICLEGRDRDFDLTSLVSVLREGHQRGAIYRTDRGGDNYDEEDW